MDVARSAPQGARYYADVIYLLPKMGIKKGASAYWYNALSIHQLGSRPTVFIPRWTAHPCILYQVCATRGAAVVVVVEAWRLELTRRLLYLKGIITLPTARNSNEVARAR